MKRFSVFILVAAFFLILTSIHPAEAALADWQKGMDIYPHWNGDYDSESFRQSLRNLKADGVTDVGFTIPIYQANIYSTDIYAGSDTPTDAALTSGINYAHSLGMRVMLKPHLESQDGVQWRAKIDPGDRDAWYRNYGNYLNHLGDIAKSTGTEGITMGTELISVAAYTSHADNTSRWQKMIADLRTHFSGYLTYDANWSWGSDNFEDEVKHIGFWGSLDYIGISAYYPLAENQNNPSVSALTGSWSYWDSSQLQGLHDTYGKPLLFTEIGYRSVNGAHNFPCCTPYNGYNGTEQANDYEALFQYWNDKSYMAGVYLWNWDTDPNYGGDGNQDYTPHNKPAEQVMKNWFGGSGDTGGTTGGTGTGSTNTGSTGTGGTSGGTNTGGTGTGTGGASGGTGGTANSPSSPGGNWTILGQTTNGSANHSNSFTVTAQNSGQATNVIVDVEVYDNSGSKVFQQFKENQNISSGNDVNYPMSWTPSANGIYTLKTGIFNSDWTKNYFWNDNVAPINIGQTGSGGNTGGTSGTGGSTGGAGGTNPGPTCPLTTDVWWPTDGSSVSGVQPFKAMVENDDASNYTMFWQVDGGSMNQMSDSAVDYPHKESWVDVSAWNWNGNGPYKLTFTAKDQSGNIISSKDVNVNVQH